MSDAPTWQLTFEIVPRYNSTERRTEVFRQERVWIGRTSECDISLPRSNASRRHCYVIVRPDGIAFVGDSMSTNGTYLNGCRVAQPTAIGVGDKIYVGDYIISLARLPERVG